MRCKIGRLLERGERDYDTRSFAGGLERNGSARRWGAAGLGAFNASHIEK